MGLSARYRFPELRIRRFSGFQGYKPFVVFSTHRVFGLDWGLGFAVHIKPKRI